MEEKLEELIIEGWKVNVEDDEGRNRLFRKTLPKDPLQQSTIVVHTQNLRKMENRISVGIHFANGRRKNNYENPKLNGRNGCWNVDILEDKCRNRSFNCLQRS